ncbi:MAG: type II secretion system F family protein [archaeon]
MKFRRRIYRWLANFYPNKYKIYLAKELVYGGEKDHVDYWLGTSFALAFFSTLAVLLYPLVLMAKYNYFFIFYAFVVFFLMHFIVYMIVYYKQMDRTQRIENSLPDMLQLVASNLKAGMTPYQSLKMASRKEFGPLREEIDYATTKALGIENFGDALMAIRDHVKSDMLDRALKLLTSSLKAGGRLAEVLENVSLDIAETRELKRDLVTSTKSYSMFIMFMVVFGAPLLLGISFQFLTMVTDLYESSVFEGGGLIGEIAITPFYFSNFAIIFLLITSILASSLMGTIKEGDFKYGLKNFPIIFFGSVILFFVVRYVVGRLLF